MNYDIALIDASNLFYKCQYKQKDAKAVVRAMIQRTEEIAGIAGYIYLLFDPIPKGDGGVSKQFSYTGLRKEIMPEYKADRKHSPLFIDCLNDYMKYYSCVGEKFKCVYSDDYEADDYVESILTKIEEGKSALLCTTDQDWQRYLSNSPQIEMCKGNIKEPYTANMFNEEFGFFPSAAANSFYKALFGDKSDCIVGAIYIKKAKFAIRIKNACLDAIKQVAGNKMSMLDLRKRITLFNFDKQQQKEELDYIDTLLETFYVMRDKFDCVDALTKNLRIISSMCEDAKPYIHSEPLKPQFHKMIKDVIFETQKPFAMKFGKF